MILNFPHELTYNLNERPDAEDVAHTIIANKRLIYEASLFLEIIYDGISIEKTKVELINISQNSPLREAYLAVILLTFQKDLERDVPKIIEDFSGMSIPEHYNTVLSFVALTIAYYGIGAAINIVRNGANGLLTHKKYKQLLRQISQKLNVPEEQIQATLDRAYLGKRRPGIMRSAINLFRPAKRQEASVIVANEFEIERGAMSEIPDHSQLDRAQPDEHAEPIENVEVRFDAQDRGRVKQGWAGTIPSISEDRLRMTIFPPLSAEALFLRPSVRGDVVLVSRRQDDGTYKPYMFHLARVRDAEPDK